MTDFLNRIDHNFSAEYLADNLTDFTASGQFIPIDCLEIIENFIKVFKFVDTEKKFDYLLSFLKAIEKVGELGQKLPNSLLESFHIIFSLEKTEDAITEKALSCISILSSKGNFLP